MAPHAKTSTSRSLGHVLEDVEQRPVGEVREDRLDDCVRVRPGPRIWRRKPCCLSVRSRSSRGRAGEIDQQRR